MWETGTIFLVMEKYWNIKKKWGKWNKLDETWDMKIHDYFTCSGVLNKILIFPKYIL